MNLYKPEDGFSMRPLTEWQKKEQAYYLNASRQYKLLTFVMLAGMFFMLFKRHWGAGFIIWLLVNVSSYCTTYYNQKAKEVSRG